MALEILKEIETAFLYIETKVSTKLNCISPEETDYTDSCFMYSILPRSCQGASPYPSILSKLSIEHL